MEEVCFYIMDRRKEKRSRWKCKEDDKTNKEAKDLLDNIEQGEYSNLLQDAIQKYEQGDYQNALNLVNKVIASKSDDEYAIYKVGADDPKNYWDEYMNKLGKFWHEKLKKEVIL